MDPNFGDWYRVAELIPNHANLVSRQTAIEAFTATCSARRVIELSQCFFGIVLENEAVSSMQRCMQETDAAFPMQNNAIELRVLAGACLVERMSEADCIAAALSLLCPSLLGNRMEILIPNICQKASQFLDSASLKLRTSQGLATTKASSTSIEAEIKAIAEAANSNTFSAAGVPITSTLKALQASIQGLVRKCNGLERNQQLFREDSDILWWLTGGYSRDLNLPLTQVKVPGVAAVIGKELADLVHVAPGPYAAQAVLDRSLEQCNVPQTSVSLTQLVNSIPPEWKQQWHAKFENKEDLLRLCPVSCAVSKSAAILGDKKWQAPFEAATAVKASIKLTPLDWAFQTYRECTLLTAIESLK